MTRHRRSPRWLTKIGQIASHSAVANVLSIAAVSIAVLAYNNSVESEIERYREEIRSLRVATLEESNKMAHLGNEMLMQLQFMLDSKPSLACKERGEFLIGQANILSVIGIAGRDTLEEEFQNWREAGEPDNSVVHSYGKNSHRGFGSLLREWYAYDVDMRAYGDQLRSHTFIVMGHCERGETPPPLPSEIKDQLNEQFRRDRSSE